MKRELEIELFRFDSKTDYLPYYKKYKIKYGEEESVLELLGKLNAIEAFCYEAQESFMLKINNLYLSADTLAADVVAKSSNTWIIEPVSIYRALNDLIVDQKDCIEKLDIFKDYLAQELIEVYAKEYALDFFASNTDHVNRSYIGDHALLTAYELIQINPDLKEEILELITSKENGIWYHTSLRHRILNYDPQKEHKIASLFSVLPQVTNTKKKERAQQIETEGAIVQSFQGFCIAQYQGVDEDSVASLIERSGASFVPTTLSKEDLAPFSQFATKDFTRNIAGEILLEAKDEGADFLIVRDEEDLALFDKEQKKIEKIVKREIELPVITQKQFVMLLQGEKERNVLGFQNHKVAISFI